MKTPPLRRLQLEPWQDLIGAVRILQPGELVCEREPPVEEEDDDRKQERGRDQTREHVPNAERGSLLARSIIPALPGDYFRVAEAGWQA